LVKGIVLREVAVTEKLDRILVGWLWLDKETIEVHIDVTIFLELWCPCGSQIEGIVLAKNCSYECIVTLVKDHIADVLDLTINGRLDGVHGLAGEKVQNGVSPFDQSIQDGALHGDSPVTERDNSGVLEGEVDAIV